MPFYNFKETDIFYNQIESTPKQEFFVFDSSVYYNNRSVQSGSFTGSVVSRRGTLSLFEANIDRSATQTGLIKPFVFATSDYIAFRNITTREYFAQLPFNLICHKRVFCGELLQTKGNSVKEYSKLL